MCHLKKSVMSRITLIFFLLALGTSAQEKETDLNFRKQIEAYNTSFSTFFMEGNIDNFSKLYTEQTIFLPEHSRERIGKKNIVDFYKQWLSEVKIVAFKKTIYELQNLGNYILEIGNFKEDFAKKDHKIYSYSGKYMILWKLAKKGKPMTIAAEIWGSDSYIDDKEFPEINDANIPNTKEYSDSDKLTVEIKERNQNIRKLVQERNGAEHAKMFMSDAIYLTYYTPMLSGIKDITDYFVDHEKPGTLKIESISIKTSAIIKTEKAVVEFGFYSVDWRDGENNGNVKGKSTNVWKRNQDNQLLLFRQMVNHD